MKPAFLFILTMILSSASANENCGVITHSEGRLHISDLDGRDSQEVYIPSSASRSALELWESENRPSTGCLEGKSVEITDEERIFIAIDFKR